jgi:hypothetical protein
LAGTVQDGIFVGRAQPDFLEGASIAATKCPAGLATAVGFNEARSEYRVQVAQAGDGTPQGIWIGPACEPNEHLRLEARTAHSPQGPIHGQQGAVRRV